MCTFYDYTNRRRTRSDRTADAIRSNFLIIYRVKLVFVTKLLLSGKTDNVVKDGLKAQ